MAVKQIIAERKRQEESKIRYEKARNMPGQRYRITMDTGLERYSDPSTTNALSNSEAWSKAKSNYPHLRRTLE